MTKETTEGNKTLAVFMGAYIKEKNGRFTAYQWRNNEQYISSTPFTCYGTKEETLEHIYKTLLNPDYGGWGRFHLFWDWFMPAWFKFRDLRMKEIADQIKHSEHRLAIINKIGYTKNNNPSEAFNLLVQAIEWYNTIKEK